MWSLGVAVRGVECGFCRSWLTVSLCWVVSGVGAGCVFMSNEECELIVALKISGVRNGDKYRDNGGNSAE